MQVLVVDDDPTVVDVVSRAFGRAGFGVASAINGERALDLVSATRPDLVILDLGLPGLDGFDVCRRIRLESQVPIIILTARDDEDNIIRAFRLGIDDYVTKPFSTRLLVARARAVLRRTGEVTRRQRNEHVQAGGLDLDIQSLEVRKDGQPVRLTPLEFRILHILAANKGRVVPYDRLIEYAWGHEGGTPSHLKIRICSIRKKLGLPIGDETGIKAIVGTGYTLRGI